MSRTFVKEPVPDKLAANLRKLRETRNLTQAELGKRAGMAAASVSHFETGQRAPSLNSLVKLADALEVSVDTLLGRESLESQMRVDPIFLKASRASAQTLDTIKKITTALLSEKESRQTKKQRRIRFET